MKFKITVAVLLSVFAIFCGALIFETGLFCNDCESGLISLSNTLEEEKTLSMGAVVVNESGYDMSSLMAMPGKNEIVTLGSKENDSEFFFELELDTKGAAIRNAYLNRYEDLSQKERASYFKLLSPVDKGNDTSVLSLANDAFVLVDQKLKLRLNNLDWKFEGKTTDNNGTDSAVFSTRIFDAKAKEIIGLKKTYEIKAQTQHLTCKVEVVNLSSENLKTRFDVQSPVGLVREGVRSDQRKIIAGYRNPQDEFETTKIGNLEIRKNIVKWRNGKLSQLELEEKLSLSAKTINSRFMWAAMASKYFTAIVRPVPSVTEEGGWASVRQSEFYEPGLHAYPEKKEDKNANSSFKFHVRDFELGAGKSKTFEFQVYLGIKDRELFEENELYSSLGFVNAIDFQTCCSFGFVKTMSFWVMGAMNWMYQFIPNYGVVIIILVLLVRLAMHPVTKKSQVSMMGMQKLGPMAEEIKKKYENNKAELNKQMMKLYRENGASPVLGCLPMLLQMPIWIALYSAIYASVELRGAAFLPFWITDLSAPDALITFPAFTIPIIGAELDAFNLLPILLGVSMFLQQKLMPHSSASANPQAAQQQKMMQWMMPIMMLIFLYKAPSGLNLYIMTSTFGGVLEQHVIRKHIREKEALEAEGKIPVTKKTGGKQKKKKPKPMFKNQM